MTQQNGFPTIAGFEAGAPFLEAYGLLMVNLILGRNGHPPRVVAVTAGGAAQGATTTVLNLGITMARSGRRVVLVDANLRRPGLHRAFGVPQAPGVAEVLIGKTSVVGAVRLVADYQLSVVPAGQATGGLQTALDPQRLGKLVADLQEGFEVVLLDTPPVLQYPDMLNLVRIVDGTVIVVPAGTSRRTQQEIRQRLSRVDGKILGAVLNRTPAGKR